MSRVDANKEKIRVKTRDYLRYPPLCQQILLLNLYHYNQISIALNLLFTFMSIANNLTLSTMNILRLKKIILYFMVNIEYYYNV